MDINTAKQIVIDAGLRLVESGLIARTWGNVSCRIDENSFVITPSGKAYESLTPADIVLVNIADLSYDGDVKPSSEKGVHAACYTLRPDCNFVIHTHQKNASAVSTLGYDINGITGRSKEIIGDCVPVAAYGLPGTGKLMDGVRTAIASCDSKAVIMKHHGAVCLGSDYDEAFKVAGELETVCMKFIMTRYRDMTASAGEGFRSVAEYINERTKIKKTLPTFEHFDSERIGDIVRMTSRVNGRDITLNLAADEPCKLEDYTASADLHKAVYEQRKDVNAIIHSDSETITEMSKSGRSFKPLLDDFAQLVGISLRTADFDPNYTVKGCKKTVKALKGRNACLLKDNGALCVAGDKSDAEAVEMVLEKNLNTQATHEMFGKKGGYIGLADSAIMRVVYKLKYSKQK